MLDHQSQVAAFGKVSHLGLIVSIRSPAVKRGRENKNRQREEKKEEKRKEKRREESSTEEIRREHKLIAG